MEVRISNVGKNYGKAGTDALRDVSFIAESGRITSLVGASGCGKTTTLRCIAGLESIDAGEIVFGNQIVATAQRSIVPTAQRNIGMVFQSYALWPHLTVAENVAFSLKTRRWSRQRIHERTKEILTLIDLPGLANRYPAQLSGGQQQRVAVGRALAYDPAILLLDEPLANLDSHLRAQMRREIRQLQRQTGVTMIYVTHDRAEAMELSDRIVILDTGHVIQVGEPTALFAKPANALVARFLGHTNFIAVDTIRADNDDRIVSTAFGACRMKRELSSGQPLTVLVTPEAIRLARANEPAPEGWLSGRGKLVPTSRAAGGVFCSLVSGGETLEVFVPGSNSGAIEEEARFFIEPNKCLLLRMGSDDV